jgi:hypothetical protein
MDNLDKLRKGITFEVMGIIEHFGIKVKSDAPLIQMTVTGILHRIKANGYHHESAIVEGKVVITRVQHCTCVEARCPVPHIPCDSCNYNEPEITRPATIKDIINGVKVRG